MCQFGGSHSAGLLTSAWWKAAKCRDDVLLSAPQTRRVSLSFAARLSCNPSTTMARAAALVLALLVGATFGEYARNLRHEVAVLDACICRPGRRSPAPIVHMAWGLRGASLPAPRRGVAAATQPPSADEVGCLPRPAPSACAAVAAQGPKRAQQCVPLGGTMLGSCKAEL